VGVTREEVCTKLNIVIIYKAVWTNINYCSSAYIVKAHSSCWTFINYFIIFVIHRNFLFQLHRTASSRIVNILRFYTVIPQLDPIRNLPPSQCSQFWETLSWSFLMSSLLVLPAAMLLGTESSSWIRVFMQSR